MRLPDILVVAEKLGLSLHPIQGGKQYETQCWACLSRGQKPDNNKYGHLSINPAKQVFRCPRCGYKGNVYTMARDLLGETRGDEFINNMSMDVVAIRTAAKRVVEEEKPPLDIDTRNAVYTELLRKLIISPSHREDLQTRGLSDDLITENRYKTTPGRDSALGIAYLLAKEGYPLDGIPGFYKNQAGKWTFMSLPGFLIPVKNDAGKIQGFQIRVDDQYLKYMNRSGDSNLRKYIWMSSVAKSSGCSSGAPIHVANPYGLDLRSTKVGITEGPIKADIAASYTGIPFLGIAGTGLYRQASETAVALGIKEPLIFYDMDKKENIHVQENQKMLLKELAQKGLRGIPYIWDESLGKGIDDMLVKISQGNIPVEQTILDSLIKIEDDNFEITVTTTVKVRLNQKLKKSLKQN